MNFQDLCFPKYLILVLTYAFLVLLSIAVIHVVFAAANMVVSSIKTCYSFVVTMNAIGKKMTNGPYVNLILELQNYGSSIYLGVSS